MFIKTELVTVKFSFKLTPLSPICYHHGMLTSNRSRFLKIAFLIFAAGLGILFYVSATFADPDLISLFPIENYEQDLKYWFQPTDANYDEPLLSEEMQRSHMIRFFNHYFGSRSPWEPGFINEILQTPAPDSLRSIEQAILSKYSNDNQPPETLGYAENFRPITSEWIRHIAENIDFNSFNHLAYQDKHRAIAVDNLAARMLPTEEVHFYSYKLAGQGYPFDNLQMSAIWAGTPLYVLMESHDHAWVLVVTPELIGWVKTNGIAYASPAFINVWKSFAKKNLAAIIQTQTPLLDEKGQYRFTAYVGSIFPAVKTSSELQLLLPIADVNRQAVIQYGQASEDQATLMPLKATTHQFTHVISHLIGRPYGWGSLYFYNDCSAELKNLLTPFGIWLPRHSSNQVYAGHLVDLSLESKEKRLSYLMQNGHRFLTLVYIGGHVMMYVGNHPNPRDKNHATMAMTYQDIWGLSPNPPTRRSVIGKSVLFPLLLQYPEDENLITLAGKKYFQVAFLDEPPNFQLKLEVLDLRAMMSMRENFN